MEKKQSKKNSQQMKHLDLDTANAASSMDCTGLIPANPKTDAELDSYQEVYDIKNNVTGEEK